jgi:uncharacterized membrane protein YcfT
MTTQAAIGQAEAAPATRLVWLDLARGASMVLVVALHADYALGRIHDNDAQLHVVNLLLVAMRLPLFFFVSGLLGARLVAGPLAGLLRRRVLLYLWLLVLWWLLQRGFEAGPAAGLGPAGMVAFFSAPPRLAEVFLVGQDDRWFLYALTLFFGLAWLLRALPVAMQAGLALLLGAAGALLLGTRLGFPALDRLYYFPYFALGVLGSARMRVVAPRLGQWQKVLPLGLGFVAACWLALRLDPRLDDRTMAALSLVALPFGVAVAVLLARHGGWAASVLRAIGRNTLVVYILHPFVLRLVFAAAERPAAFPRAGWVLLVAAVALAASLYLGRLLARIPGVFSLPSLTALRPGAVRGAVAERG